EFAFGFLGETRRGGGAKKHDDCESSVHTPSDLEALNVNSNQSEGIWLQAGEIVPRTKSVRQLGTMPARITRLPDSGRGSDWRWLGRAGGKRSGRNCGAGGASGGAATGPLSGTRCRKLRTSI